MYDEIFGEVIFDYDYVAKKNIIWAGKNQEVEIRIAVDEDEKISQVQRDSFEALMQNWDEMQCKLISITKKICNCSAPQSSIA